MTRGSLLMDRGGISIFGGKGLRVGPEGVAARIREGVRVPDVGADQVEELRVGGRRVRLVLRRGLDAPRARVHHHRRSRPAVVRLPRR